MEQVIKRILERHEEQGGRLSQIDRYDEDRYDLADLWDRFESQTFYVFDDYPTHNNDYEQSWSGVKCKYIEDGDVWLCVDEIDGYYLASKDEVSNWDLRDSEDGNE